MPESRPSVELSGRYVTLRSFTEQDLTDQYISWLNDPFVVRWSNQRFVRHDRASCQRFLNSFARGPNKFFSIRESASGLALGTATAYLSPHHGTADAGILLGERGFWGKGLGQDAWNTLIGWLSARPDLRKLTAGTLACNRPMVRLMERSGMTLEAVRRRHEVVDGREVDILLYAKFLRDAA